MATIYPGRLQNRVKMAKLQPGRGASGVLERMVVAKPGENGEIATGERCQIAVRGILWM